MTKKTSLEEAFAIGRPARSAAYKTCSRCRGTGWWQLGRQCFKCGGVGHAEVSTIATQLRDARAHLAERLGLVAKHRARLAKLDARGITAGWRRSPVESWLEKDLVTVAKIEAEIAALEAAS